MLKPLFIVKKGYSSASEVQRAISVSIAQQKRLKSRYNTPFQYVYVIAYSHKTRWHAHIIANRWQPEQGEYCERVRDKRAAALYLVENVARSRNKDYGATRRTRISLYCIRLKSKQAFRNRAQLFRYRAQHIIIKHLILRCTLRNPSYVHKRQVYATRQPAQPTQPATRTTHRPRAPP